MELKLQQSQTAIERDRPAYEFQQLRESETLFDSQKEMYKKQIEELQKQLKQYTSEYEIRHPKAERVHNSSFSSSV